MIKKYVTILAILLAILMFTSTSTASFLSLKGKIYERLQENSAFKKVLERISQIVSYNDNIASTDADKDDEDEEDDDLMDTDDPLEEDILLPKIWNLVGEKTPDDGNEPVDDSEETAVIDVQDDKDETTQQDELTVDLDGNKEAINGEAIDKGEWTVEHDGEGGTLDRFVKIFTERNVKLGAMLQRVVERTFAPGTTESDGVAENIVDTVVVAGGSLGTVENNKADVVVLTDGDQ